MGEVQAQSEQMMAIVMSLLMENFYSSSKVE